MAVDGFTFFKSFYLGLKNLDDHTYREVMDAICEHAFTDNEADLEGVARALYEVMIPNVDSSINKREAGRKGGKSVNADVLESKTESAYKQNEKCLQAKPKVLTSNKDKDKDKDKEEDKDKNKEENKEENKEPEKGETGRSARFTPPTVEEVRDYCLERNNGIDAEQFVDFYSSKGWVVGKNKMKDWKACVRTWERRDRASPKKDFDSNEYLLGIINGGDVYDSTGSG